MKKEKIFQEEKKVMKKKIIAAFLTTAMTIGSLSGVTVFAAEAGTDEKVEMADASDSGFCQRKQDPYDKFQIAAAVKLCRFIQ
jgi:peptidoglycan hydrolase CwlO-like protein